MKHLLAFLRAWFAFLVVGGAFVGSALAIVAHRREEAPPGAIVLRIGHWQLEAGVRDALDRMAEEYRRIKPNVYIVQDAIPESLYGQWVSTQLMGGTAPDILECGNFLPKHIWISYYNRYMVPLTASANQPNPYNEGTDLEGVPLRLTIKDGMRSTYIEEMQEFMLIPLAQFGVRIYYNRDLLRRLTGREEAPMNYREFLRVCEEIKTKTNEAGDPYIPIACSRYHLPMWESRMLDPLTYPAVRRADFNRDGYVGKDELFVAVKTDRIDFGFPPFRARYHMLSELTRQFQTGFTGLGRDEAVFLFAQQKAVFISTGSWDAGSLRLQAEGTFDVGVMDFPIPDRDDPDYGEIIEGPLYEKPESQFPFGIARTCEHPEVALDFLLFLAGKKQNEEMNRIIGWIPSIRGTEMDPALRPFEPHLRGVYGALDLNLGGETWIKYFQLYSLYQIDQISYDDLIAEFEPFYKEQGLKDFLEQQKDWRRGMHINEQLIAGMRSRALLADLDGEPDAISRWVKYRTLSSARQIWSELDRSRQLRLLEQGPALGAVGPYEYSEEVLEKVRRRVAKASD